MERKPGKAKSVKKSIGVTVQKNGDSKIFLNLGIWSAECVTPFESETNLTDMIDMIGKIQRVPLRQVTLHEAHDFTKWLVDHVDVLNEVLDLTLVDAKREQRAGAFSVDIVAEDEASGDTVVIENQLEKSNHDHLGKLVTYLSNLDAKIAVWIVAEPKPEHVTAIGWLNESRLAKFYLVKVEAIKIGGSEPAFLFTQIVGPSEEAKLIGDSKEAAAERHDLRKKFWTLLLEMAKGKTNLHSNITPGKYSWIATGAGVSGLGYNYVIKQTESAVELYIDKKDDGQNELIFDTLLKHKSEVETSFGETLEWERLENRRACRIRKTISLGGYQSSESDWFEIHEKMIDSMIKLERALKPFVQKLKI